MCPKPDATPEPDSDCSPAPFTSWTSITRRKLVSKLKTCRHHKRKQGWRCSFRMVIASAVLSKQLLKIRLILAGKQTVFNKLHFFQIMLFTFWQKKRGFRLSIQGVNTIFAQLRVTGITPKDYSTRNSHTPTYKHGKQPLKITSTFFMLHSVQSGLALPVPSPYKKNTVNSLSN